MLLHLTSPTRPYYNITKHNKISFNVTPFDIYHTSKLQCYTILTINEIALVPERHALKKCRGVNETFHTFDTSALHVSIQFHRPNFLPSEVNT
jgi:hypothetical protein